MPASTYRLPRQLTLEAKNPSRNIARRYWLRISRDLFGATIVEHGWGRIGSLGQERRVAFDDDKIARAFVRGILRRRKSAPRRIGVAYRPTR